MVGPHGYATPGIDLDLRVGGGYRFTMQPPDGDRFHLAGEFLEIEPPSRLVYTFRWEEPDPDDRETVVTLSLDEVGDATQVSLSQGQFATEERLELHRSGWTDSSQKLRELIDSSAYPPMHPGKDRSRWPRSRLRRTTAGPARPTQNWEFGAHRHRDRVMVGTAPNRR
jgi:uncharacterized protein YndB with AHSA1/START domain